MRKGKEERLSQIAPREWQLKERLRETITRIEVGLPTYPAHGSVALDIEGVDAGVSLGLATPE